MTQKPPSVPVSRRICSNRARSAGSAFAEFATAGSILRRDDRPQRLIRRTVPSNAAPNTANGAIQASRLKPFVGGAASTVIPYFVANQLKICGSVFPASICACRSAISCPREGQPTWSHPPSNCAQPQVHITWLLRLSKREALLLAPMENPSATTSRNTSAVLIQNEDRKRTRIFQSPPLRTGGAMSPAFSCPAGAARAAWGLPAVPAGTVLGTIATRVPKTITTSPAQIQPTSGFRNALMIGRPVSGFVPS